MDDTFNYEQDFEGPWSQQLAWDTLEGNWEGDESSGFGAIPLGHTAAGASLSTSSFTPDEARDFRGGQELPNVPSGDECFDFSVVIPTPLTATNPDRGLTHLNTGSQNWNTVHDVDDSFMWDPTRIVGIDPPLKPESEPRLPECGAWPVYGDSSPSKTHSIPPSCPLNEAESQAPALNNRTTATRNIGPFADTEFVFESRAILIGPNQAPISRQRKPRDGSALECGFPGCHSRATFERKYELQRHMKKHERQVTYPCPAIDCDRIGLRSFYRMDKPVHHLRTGHGNNDSYRCPLEECSVGPMPIEGIALHTRDHRYTSNRMLRVFQRIPRDKRQCMLKGCSKQLSIWNMQSHLTSRTINHRMKETSVIQRMGYDAETGKIICPLCKALLCNHDRFITHLEYDHFIADPAHFSKFKESTNDMPLPGPRYSWKSWMPHSYLTVLGSNWTMVGSNWTGLQGRTCPTYRQPASSGDRPGHVDHHLQLRADLDVRPYRWDILRLWPEFDSHPVFNDIKLSVHV